MTAVAIFVKTPGLSPLKTRLAASIGQPRTHEIYSACAAAVAEVSVSAAIGPVYWAVAEAADQAGAHWSDLPLLEQGDGGLGERMHRVMAELVRRHGSGLLLGADAPQIDADCLRQAADWLDEDQPRCVIGPARDGGFWTFGANHEVAESCWTRVTYSRADTLHAFTASMGRDAQWLELSALTDLDTVEELDVVRYELGCLAKPALKQQALMRKFDGLSTPTQAN